MATVFRTMLWSKLFGKTPKAFETLQRSPEELLLRMATVFRTILRSHLLGEARFMATVFKTILWSELQGKAQEDLKGLQSNPEELSARMGTVFRTNLWA